MMRIDGKIIEMTRFLALGAGAVALAVSIILMFNMRGDAALLRYGVAPPAEFDARGADYRPTAGEFYDDRIRADQIELEGSESDKAVRILQWWSNKVTRKTLTSNLSAKAVLERAEGGGGLTCDGMSTGYMEALAAIGIGSRRISLTRNFYSAFDTHTVVEVYLNGRWVFFDPSFNVSFVRDGVLLGAKDIHAALLNGRYRDIEPLHYGVTNYPPVLEDYYLNWLPLFENVSRAREREIPWIYKLPPLRYWLGSERIYLQVNSSEALDLSVHVKSHNRLYFLAVVVLPVFGLLAVLMGLFPFFRNRGSVAGRYDHGPPSPRA